MLDDLPVVVETEDVDDSHVEGLVVRMHSDNVVRCDLADSVLLFPTMIAATTLQAPDNRLRETPRHALASMYTLGVVNQTSDNLGTHCILAFEWATGSWVGVDNRSIVDLVVPGYCPRPDEFAAVGGGFN